MTQRRRIDRILDPGFLADLDAITIDEVRERRALCDGVENELSYYRRLLHGRMDLLAFELRRRSGEESRTMLEALPEILAGSESRRTDSGRSVALHLPDIPGSGKREVDRALGDDFLAHLPDADDAELERIQAALVSLETQISGQRRRVYEVYEAIQAELTRRYREGLADADELLRNG